MDRWTRKIMILCTAVVLLLAIAVFAAEVKPRLNPAFQNCLQTKYVDVAFGRIAYYESSGKGPAVVLVHGNSSSKQAFTRQLNGLVGHIFRIVAIDLPGHGESVRAADPFSEYTVENLTDMLAEVALKLDLQDAVFVGWSLGGHLVLEASAKLPQARGFMITGTPPMQIPFNPDSFLPNPSMNYSFMPVLTEEQIAEYLEASFRPGADIPGFFYDEVRNTDGMLRYCLGGIIMTGSYSNESEIVQNLDRPLAVLHGEEDQLVNLQYIESLSIPTLWRGSIQIIPWSGHTPQWENPIWFNALLAQFVLYANYH